MLRTAETLRKQRLEEPEGSARGYRYSRKRFTLVAETGALGGPPK